MSRYGISHSVSESPVDFEIMRVDCISNYHLLSFLRRMQRVKMHLLLALIQSSGPSCSKLTMSSVNDLLKFTSSDTQIS